MKIEWFKGTLEYPDMNLVNLLITYLKNNEINKVSYGKLIQIHKKVGKIVGDEKLANGIQMLDKKTKQLNLKLKDVTITLKYIEMDDLYSLQTMVVKSY